MTKDDFIKAVATVAVDFQSNMLKVLEEYNKEAPLKRSTPKKIQNIDEIESPMDVEKIKKELDATKIKLDIRESKIKEKEDELRQRGRDLSSRNTKLSSENYRLKMKEQDLSKLKEILESETNLLDDSERKLIINIIDYAMLKGYWVTNRLDKLNMDETDVNRMLRKLGLSEKRIKNMGI